jgi:hypothetical protein
MAFFSRLRKRGVIGFLRLISRRHECHGLEIRLLTKPGTRKAQARKVEEALDLIARVAPFRLERLKREVQFILVTPLGCEVGQWWHGPRICLVNEKYTQDPDFTPAQLAATVIHEVTHGRLERAGIRYDEARRAEIEGICLREEIRFARRLPDGEDVIRWAEATLAWTNEDLSDAAARARDRESLKEDGCPQWIINRLWPEKPHRQKDGLPKRESRD